ncbi:MAG: hypothetical protein MZV49_12045 [Rhodopseudomonas palustris]|nr:hypothetical protein [Rhodopseudomonas palustris]
MHERSDQIPARRKPHAQSLVQPRRPTCPTPLPPVLHPGTMQPVGPGRSRAAVPDGADPAGSVATEREIEIPEPVRDVLPAVASHAAVSAPAGWRQALDTPARIYYKYEGVSPAGSHKPNTAVAAGVLQQGSRRQAASPPKPAPGSGARRWLSPARCSASTCRCSWCACPTTRSPIAGR